MILLIVIIMILLIIIFFLFFLLLLLFLFLSLFLLLLLLLLLLSLFLFTPLRVGGPPTPQAFLANSNIYTKNQALASKNHSKYRYLQCFFISVRFSLAGSRPKWPKIPFQYHLKLRHPKIVEKTRKHHQYDTRSRCEIVFAPPPELKLI